MRWVMGEGIVLYVRSPRRTNLPANKLTVSASSILKTSLAALLDKADGQVTISKDRAKNLLEMACARLPDPNNIC